MSGTDAILAELLEVWPRLTGRGLAVADADRVCQGGAWCWRVAGAAGAEDEGRGRVKPTQPK